MRYFICISLMFLADIGSFKTFSLKPSLVGSISLWKQIRSASHFQQPFRLRGGSEWHVRITRETAEAVENSSIVKSWYAQFENCTAENKTEDELEMARPFIQMDTLMFMLKRNRDSLTDASGRLVADAYSESHLPNISNIGSEPLAVWVNKKLNTRCILLRGDCMGIGGKTLAEFVAERGNVTDDDDEDEDEVVPCRTRHDR